MTRRLVGMLWASSLAMVVVGWAVPAAAQNGTMSGRVVDSDRRATDRDGKPLGGKPKDPSDSQLGLSEATVTLEFKGESARKFQVVTDAMGEWYKSGLPPGTYDISVRKEWRDPVPGRTTKLVVFIAKAPGVVLKPGEKLRVPDMAALTEEALAAGRRPPAVAAAGLSNAAVEAANKQTAEMEALFKDANAASEAGNYAEAVAKLTTLAEKLAEQKKPCGACYAKIGEAQLKLNAPDKAEAAFLKSIEIDPTPPDAYSQLASIYNGQRKFDEAAKMSAKATELMGASGGGGDAVTVFNLGIINWNAGKYEEAKAQFEKAVKIDPKMANAQYYLGMAIFNLASTGKGAMADAKAPFLEYLKLAPTGEFAEVAKAILATIK